ncbi:hypothetical protein KI387_011030, partial [Taxus chinensis]
YSRDFRKAGVNCKRSLLGLDDRFCFVKVIGFVLKVVGRFHARYPETKHLYYRPSNSPDSQNCEHKYDKVVLRFNSFRGHADAVEMVQVA